MKTPRIFSLLILSIAGLLVSSPRAARADVSVDFFYDSLDPYGQWIEVGDYGYCWRPEDVDADWAPYTDGYWTYTDAGWTWVSYEDWGGITHHYGRWTRVEDEGWCWVPGREWGPAWVSWRNSDDYVGWAPLPPEAHWRPSVGFSVWVDNSYDIGPGSYNFCNSYDFGSPMLRPVILPRSQNVTIIKNTVNITNITYNNSSRVVYNGGPDFAAINRRSRRQVPALKLVQHANVDDLRGGRKRGGKGRGALLPSEQRGNQLEVVAPTITQADGEKALKPKKVAKTVSKDKVNKGWASVKDPEERRQIKQQMEQQTRNLSPETAPAKPVQVADLKVLPEKADPNAPSPATTAKGKGKGKGIGAGDSAEAKGKKIADEAGDRSRKGDEGRREKPDADPAGVIGQANAAQGEKPGKEKGRGKADAIAAPAAVTPDGPVASTENDVNDRERARRSKDAADVTEKLGRENGKNRQAQRAADQEKAVAKAQDRATQRRALEAEMARDQAELAAARARRQQETASNMQEEKRREKQRAAASEDRTRQRNDDDVMARRRQQQVDGEREAYRQQAARERQLQPQREMQQQRSQQQRAQQQQQQQYRALEAQRAAQHQRQTEAHRQMQIHRQPQQQPPQRQQGGGGGGGGGGGQGGKRHLSEEERAQLKKQRGF